MNGIVSQWITLATYGNDYLKNDCLPADFYPDNPAFKFCNSVQFYDAVNEKSHLSPTIKTLGETPLEWFAYLKDKGCKNLRLFFNYSGNESISDYKTAGMVGGGGTWHLEANYPEGTDIWAVNWEVSRQDSENQIWTVQYGLVVEKTAPTQMPCDLNVIKQVSDERLHLSIDFCRKQKLEKWQQQFEKALSLLYSEMPEENDFLKTLFPYQNYSLAARQLLCTACEMDVFGGMGSWNDLYFEDKEVQQQYEKLSESLFDNRCVNILAAVNTY